ncbi:hypothetical protein [Streptomyces sp. NPDC048192]|uniref:ABC transporter ATP-binding protein n=1 Tax=Streptomyces sp. NPDC048192 TaxID=3365510 RepID=UPI0037107F7C
MTHRALVLRRGAVVEEGTTDQITTHPAHTYTRALLAAAEHATPPDRGLTSQRLRTRR